MRVALVVTAFALVAMVPPATSQGTIPDPYPGCDARPHECDPLAANGGRVRTGDEPVRLILYAHFEDLLGRAPMNTQPPDPEHEPDLDASFLMPTLDTEDLPCCDFRSNHFRMFSSPGLVEVLPDGNWRVHREPGLPGELKIVSPEITGYFYLSPGVGPNRPADTGPASSPGVLPGIGVYMQVNVGRLPTDRPDWLIAHGDTGPGYGQTVPTGPGGVTLVSRPGEDTVYEFRVPMKVQMPRVPSGFDEDDGKRHGFTVVAIPYQYESDQMAFTQADWSLRTGYRYPPRIIMDVVEPLKTDDIVLTVSSPEPQLAWTFTPAFGKYDFDRESLSLNVDGPTEIGFPPPDRIRQNHSNHGFYTPLRAAWRLPMDGAADGTYVATASILNYQRTYELTTNLTFEVRDGRVVLPSDATLQGGSAGIPGAGLLWAVGALVAAGALRRR